MVAGPVNSQVGAVEPASTTLTFQPTISTVEKAKASQARRTTFTIRSAIPSSIPELKATPMAARPRGAPGNAGGGGTDTDIAANQENSGGGGGGNGGTGGQGGKTWRTNLDRGGHGGAAFTSAAANTMIMGGGGGAGTRNNSSGTMSSGAAGGGIVMIRAGTISGSGTISVNGSAGNDADNDGGGGGGAGGKRARRGKQWWSWKFDH